MNIVEQQVTTLKKLEFTPEEARLIMEVAGSTHYEEMMKYMSSDEARKVGEMYSKWFDYMEVVR